MKSLTSSWAWLVVLVVLLGSSESAFADGKFFRRLEVADEPGIRAQRAVIAFKDGVETLIVQSDVEGEDTSYGWLLPLPAEPSSVEPCLANSLNALAGAVRPKIVDTPRSWLGFSVILMLVVVVGCLDHVDRKSRGIAGVSWATIVLAIVVLLLVAYLFAPSLAMSRGLAAGVEVIQTMRAGVYDVAIVKGKTGDAVESWLTDNGFACPPSATGIIRDYASQGWCFLAAKVSPEAAGAVTHHPLKVAFPASEAVYPLRLTGSDGEPVQLDLFVIAERRASAAAMQSWFCDSYSRDIAHHSFDEYACEVPPLYAAREIPSSRIGIPAVSSLMWPGCVLTRLHGRLDAADMAQDLSLTWLDPEPMQITLYSLGGAVSRSASLASLALAACFACLTPAAVRKGWSRKTMIRRWLGPALVLGLLVGGAHWATLEVVPTKSTARSAGRSTIRLTAHWHALRHLSETLPASPFPDAYRDLLLENASPEALAEAAELKRPGDFTIEPTNDGWRLTIIEWPYTPVTIPISADGVPRAATD